MNAVTLPLPTVTSARSNPVTASEKAMATSKGPSCASVGPLTVTVGRVWSPSTEYRAAAVLPSPSASTATFAGTSTVTVPEYPGVILISTL